jgi:hypothetical protein
MGQLREEAVMKLPALSAERSLVAGERYATGASAPSTPSGVLPMLNIGCLIGCAANALGCLHCGTNLGCWASCAGPGAVQCIAGCL